MSEVTRILSAIAEGDPHAAEQLLPLVYDDLRHLAAQKMAQEKPGQTLQATALVHEAYLRLVTPPESSSSPKQDQRGRHWDSRGHFFAAAAEAMRRILVDNYRHHHAQKRGAGFARIAMPELAEPARDDQVDLLALDEALSKLEEDHPEKVKLVKLRFYAGCSLEETAQQLGISRATAQRQWAFARAWLFGQLHQT
jgi:RNA polymerase sigma factor (TIGR02999 family)